ncbi:hypothetical protein M752DRAFT_148877 [Aspergillus phoenicis ATCC 13157]|uniref:Uncharacterized protein n=1 Tax=Aspergillus phoenicis ATCC 13157 TaxID=1353007 RepID=A0A370PPA6_ASPPH|nr:hypothetical protein M752DRAFT_148877 [Aspergillus phoenicis ATCC 13157]
MHHSQFRHSVSPTESGIFGPTKEYYTRFDEWGVLCPPQMPGLTRCNLPSISSNRAQAHCLMFVTLCKSSVCP